MKLPELQKKHEQLKAEAIKRLKEVIRDNGGVIETNEEGFPLLHRPDMIIHTITEQTYTVDIYDEVFPIEDLEIGDALYLIANHTKDESEL